MAIRIVPYTAELEQQTREFNTRLKAGGSSMKFPESHIPQWLPRRQGNDLYQEHFWPSTTTRRCGAGIS